MRKLTTIQTITTAGTALALSLVLGACGPGMDDAESGSTETTMSEDMDHSAASVEPVSTGDPFADTMTAASHMPMTAQELAAGITAAADIEGDSDSEASDLRVALTATLQEHVYLAGIAVATAYTAGADSEEFELAQQAVDANSEAMADIIGDAAGEEKRTEFLEQWREHIGYFIDYAVAAQEDDDAGREAAAADLQAYAEEAGPFFEEISGGELPAADVTAGLEEHIETLATAVDSLAAGDPSAYEDLRTAAHHGAEAGGVFATGFATALELDGDPNDDAATLRADLTANLQEHVYLAGIAVFTAYTSEGGTESEAFAAAAETVDENAVALSEKIGEIAGDDQAEAFLELWREHIGYFVDYAEAKAMDDQGAADQALAELDEYRPEAGAFFEEITGGELPAQDVADGLAVHVSTLAGAIDSLATSLVK